MISIRSSYIVVIAALLSNLTTAAQAENPVRNPLQDASALDVSYIGFAKTHDDIEHQRISRVKLGDASVKAIFSEIQKGEFVRQRGPYEGRWRFWIVFFSQDGHGLACAEFDSSVTPRQSLEIFLLKQEGEQNILDKGPVSGWPIGFSISKELEAALFKLAKTAKMVAQDAKPSDW